MTTLRTVEIFESLQGEGYWTGIPMTFVRLAGCNAPELGLGCVAWCDTPGSWDPAAGEELEATEIVRRVRLPRLCLTGGEPLLQAEGTGELVAEAHRWGIRVHVETNGTVNPPASLVQREGPTVAWQGAGAVSSGAADARCAFDWVVISPKPPGYFVAPQWAGLADELKLVVDDQLDAATAERLAAAHPGAVVFLQPESRAGAATGMNGAGGVAGRSGGAAGPYQESCNRAIALVMDHPEWRLSLQVHKLLGIR